MTTRAPWPLTARPLWFSYTLARYIVSERVDRVEGLQAFGSGDYRYDAALSTADEWVFTRPYRTMAMEADEE